MRSNIASTWGSARRPAELIREVLLQTRQEVDELVELLGVRLLERRERRHRWSRVDQGSGDRLAPQPRADVREGRPRPRVAVLADLVTAKAAGGRHRIFALLVLRGHLHVDLRRR